MISAGFAIVAAAAAVLPVEPVGQIYRDACLAGELRVERSQGAVVEESSLPGDLRGLTTHGDHGPLGRSTFLKLSQPANTYVLMKWFGGTRTIKPTYVCGVVSRRWTLVQANAAFVADTPRAEAVKAEFGDWWYIDVPQSGERKELLNVGINWIAVLAEIPDVAQH